MEQIPPRATPQANPKRTETPALFRPQATAIQQVVASSRKGESMKIWIESTLPNRIQCGALNATKTVERIAAAAAIARVALLGAGTILSILRRPRPPNDSTRSAARPVP